MAKVKVQHIPYRGSAPALQDLRRRQCRLHVRQSRRLAAAGAGRQAEAARGRLAQPHGVAAERADDRRNVAGLRIGRLVRGRRAAKTPKEIADKINADINEALRQPEMQEQLKKLSAEVVGGSAERRRNICARKSSAGTQ